MTERKKILITGNLGYIGSRLTNEAQRRDWHFFGIDKELQSGEFLASFNLCDEEKTLSAVKAFQPDVLIHAGSHSALIYKDDFYNPLLEDFISLKNVVKALQNLPSCRLVYFSSSYVYSGLPKDSPVVEDDALKPAHNFGVAKSFFEQFILRNHKNSVVFRLCSAFGPGNALHPNTILLFVKECLEKGEIGVWGEGKRKLQYVYNKDVVNYVFESFSLAPGIYNLGGNEYLTVSEAGKMVAEFFGSKIKFLTQNREGETLPYLINEKIKKASSKNLFTPFPKALSEYLSLLRK